MGRVGFASGTLVPESKPLEQGLGLQDLGKLKTQMIWMANCYKKILEVETLSSHQQVYILTSSEVVEPFWLYDKY